MDPFASANAGSLTANWDFDYMQDPVIAANPSILSFRLYSRTGTAAYNYSTPIATAQRPPLKVTGLQSGATYCFVLRAFKSNNNLESPNSNEICPKVPKLNPPSGFKLIDFDMNIRLNTRLIHFLGYYKNSETNEIITMETISEL